MYGKTRNNKLKTFKVRGNSLLLNILYPLVSIVSCTKEFFQITKVNILLPKFEKLFVMKLNRFIYLCKFLITFDQFKKNNKERDMHERTSKYPENFDSL